MKSILLTPRHEIIYYSALLVVESIFLDPEARVAFVSLVMGVLLWWSRFYWPRGTKLFLTVLSLWWSRSFGPRGTSLTCFPCCGCPHSVEPILLTPRYRFIFYSALPVMRSIVWIPRHEFVMLPLLWVPSFSGADLVDPEVRIYFLQWITLWHPDSGLFVSLQQIRWKNFFVCAQKLSFPCWKVSSIKVHWSVSK